MQDKLELLLDQIKLPEENKKHFSGGQLEKIICNKNKDKYVFLVMVNKPLPLDVYLNFEELLKDGFKTATSVSSKIACTNYEQENIEEYYHHYLDEYSVAAPLLATFKNSNLVLEEKNLIIDVANTAEEMKLASIKDDLEKKLNNNGFDIKINIKIDEAKAEEIRKEIELQKTAEVPKVEKKVNPIIMGNEIKSKIIDISSLTFEMDNISVEAKIIKIVPFESPKSDFKIYTLTLYDGTDSIYCKIFCRDPEDFKRYGKGLKEGTWYKVRGYTKNDKYSGEIVLNARDINISQKKDKVRMDNAEEKRIELHAHTKMSQMDGVVDANKLVKTAFDWGHRGIAITDHNGLQAFPGIFNFVKKLNKTKENDPFKVLYGVELTVIDDRVDIVLRPTDSPLLDTTYVVFDFETTGFNAGGADSIIEVGAVKICNGEIIDRFSELINPGRKLPAKIIEITNITDSMLKDKDNEEAVIKRFKEWYQDLPMVAHNAKFDISFLTMALNKYKIGEFNNTVIDTLELSRTLDNNYARHGLSALVKRYEVPWDEDAHHRADYDAEGTALVLYKMLKKLESRNFETINDLTKLVSKEEIHKYGKAYHINLMVQNQTGLKNLFKLISLATTKYLYKTPRILRSEIENYKEGILIGSGCYESEIFKEARSKTDEELSNLINFYDYVEVQPIDVYNHLIQTGDFGNKLELIEHLRKIIRVTKEAGKLIVATGDVHQLSPDDLVYRKIIVNQKVPGGGRHPLARKNITEIPNQYFRTTNEMLESFDFLSNEEAKELVIENPNKILDMVEPVEIIIDTQGVPFSPIIEGSAQTTTDLVFEKAESIYGSPLPHNIEERIAGELYGDDFVKLLKEKLKDKTEKEIYIKLHEVVSNGKDSVKDFVKTCINIEGMTEEEIQKEVDKNITAIIGANFDVIYLIAQKLVKKSNDNGYLVGSRGSVGSSFVATMMGITEVNPLPPHYVCPKCHHSIFEKDNRSLGSDYASGFDLPRINCPKCDNVMDKDGQDMPFATFLGFHADKVPDIDLNFSDLDQANAHEYTKELFGVDNVYRAGTIGTVAEKTAFGYVKGFCEDKGINMRTAEVERLAQGCTGIKRTTGQHPGGIVVIPGYMEVFDFTPFQFPADDVNSKWRTTHFNYHELEDDLLKLDILGHSGPTQLRLIQDLTGMDVTKVPLDDPDTMEIFLSPKSLGVTKEEILNDTGTLGIPEFGTPFTIAMVRETKPKTFGELLKISGLSHGTDVWNGNAQDLINNNIVPFSEVIGCRDDIMVYLSYHGLKPIRAFKIMEFVRKGKASGQPEEWAKFKEELKEAGIAEWYIESCEKIKYMFPKAHAAAYVINAFRIAYFKVHRPGVYYASQFSTQYTDFDIEAMIKGYETVRRQVIELSSKGFSATNKESGTLECLKLALEALARGITFGNIDLNKSDAMNFILSEDEKTIIPPFRSLDGLGDVVAKNIVDERNKAPFLSIEDFQKRAKVSMTITDKMRMMGVLDGMDESSQLSLF